jgi:hypothetical protein
VLRQGIGEEIPLASVARDTEGRAVVLIDI